jgi:hypothetical protein
MYNILSLNFFIIMGLFTPPEELYYRDFSNTTLYSTDRIRHILERIGSGDLDIWRDFDDVERSLFIERAHRSITLDTGGFGLFRDYHHRGKSIGYGSLYSWFRNTWLACLFLSR